MGDDKEKKQYFFSVYSRHVVDEEVFRTGHLKVTWNQNIEGKGQNFVRALRQSCGRHHCLLGVKDRCQVRRTEPAEKLCIQQNVKGRQHWGCGSGQHLQCDLNERLARVVEHEVIVRHAVPDRVVRADDVEERREERESVSVLSRREESDPLVRLRLRVR